MAAKQTEEYASILTHPVPLAGGCRLVVEQAFAAEERVDAGLFATEGLVELHRVVAAPTGEDVFAEGACFFGVEDVAGLFEGDEGVGVEHFSPGVDVVAGCVASVEDVAEVGAAVAHGDFGNQADAVEGRFFECLGVDAGSVPDGVVCHVEEGCGHEFDNGEALVEEAACLYFVNQFLGHGLAGFPVAGVGLQDFGGSRPVFHDLRGQFHEVVGYGCAGDAGVGAAGEQAVEGVAELVEEGAGFVEGEERGGVARGLGEVADVDYDRGVAEQCGLRAEGFHPGSAAFAGTGEVVGVEDADVAAVGVFDFKGEGFGVGQGQVVALLEGDAVEFVGNVECAFAYLFEGEVLADFGFVKAVFFFFEFLAVVAPVPGGELEVAAGAVNQFLEFGSFAFCVGKGCVPDLVAEGIDVFGRFCHVGVDDVGGVVFVAEKGSFFSAQGYHFADDAPVVVGVVVAAPVDVGFVYFFAQGAVVGVLEEGHDAGVVEGEYPFALHAPFVGCVGSGGDDAFGQPAEVFFTVDDELVGVGFFQLVGAELEAEEGEAAVDFGEPLLGVGGEVGSATDEGVVVVFEHPLLFGGEVGCALGVVDGFDAPEEFFVEVDAVIVGGELGHDFFGNGFQGVGGVGFLEVDEDIAHAVEELP